MFKNQVYKKALYRAPDELKEKIFLQAAEKMNFSEETESDWLEYANWIPLLGFFILLRNLLTGNKLSISPTLTI